MINATWHKKHIMPKNPTLAERTKWHMAHAKQCGCRAMPKSMQALVNQIVHKKGK